MSSECSGAASFLLSVAAALAPTGGAIAEFRFGPWERTIGDLADAAGVAIDSQGTIAVTESLRHRVSFCLRDGTLVGAVGAEGVEPGLLRFPTDVAFLPDGRLCVADTGNDRVQVLSREGESPIVIGSRGRGPGLLCEPRGVCAYQDLIFVADTGNHRLQVFGADGTFRQETGRFGAGNGEFRRPLDVTVTDHGRVFVIDSDAARIQEFTADLTFVRAWGEFGAADGMFDEPAGIDWHGDQIFVADRRNHRLQGLTAEGAVREVWGIHAMLPREGEGKLHYPDAVAVAPDGTFAVVAEAYEDRVQVIRARAEGEPPPGKSLIPGMTRLVHFGDQMSISGELLLVPEPEAQRAYIFECTAEIPIVIGDFGERGWGSGLFMHPAGACLDVPRRTLWVSDTTTRRLNELVLSYDEKEPRGYSTRRVALSRSWDLSQLTARAKDAALPWVIEPVAIRALGDELVVLDARNRVAIVFDRQMQVRRVLGRNAGLAGPVDIALSAGGSLVHVVDAASHRIMSLDAKTGEVRRRMGKAGDGMGDFRRASGIVEDSEGTLFVADAGRSVVQVFNAHGHPVRTIAAPGTDHGQLWKPRGLGLTDDGRLFVLDSGNHRAQIFSKEGEWLVTFGTGRAYTRDSVRRKKEGAAP